MGTPPLPWADNPLGEEIFSNIQPKPLAQPEAVSSHAVVCCLGEEAWREPHIQLNAALLPKMCKNT